MTSAVHRTALSGITVVVFSRNGSYLASSFTDDKGSFEVVGLKPAAPGDVVCFDASTVTVGTGYASQCYKRVPWNTATAPPARVKPVPVRAGRTTAGIDASLSLAGAIAGKVVAAKGGRGVGNVTIDVFDSGGIYLASALTSAAGNFEVKGLIPTSKTGKGDTVCFDASTAAGSQASYVSQCYLGIAWSPASFPPAGVTGSRVIAGKVKTGVNAALVAGGSIAGSLTVAGRPTRLGGVTVDVYSPGGNLLGSAISSSRGSYSVGGLPATAAGPASATGDTVCFDASAITSGTGYASQCYRHVAWSPSSPPPAGVTRIKVTAGSATTGVTAALALGGAIAGTVKSARSKAGLAGVAVVVIGPGGQDLAFAITSARGKYQVDGLPATGKGAKRGDFVCFDASLITGYRSQCYRGVAWTASSPPPARAGRIRVAAGHATAGIDGSLH